MMNNINKTERIILYEDRDILVCRKPAGIPVQTAAAGQKDMVSILKNYLSEAEASQVTQFDPGNGSAGKESGKSCRHSGRKIPEIYVVHRLDQPVEGVMVFAKTQKAAAGLSRQAADGRMRKIYQAVCCVENSHVLTSPEAKADQNKAAGDPQKKCTAEKNKIDGNLQKEYAANQNKAAGSLQKECTADREYELTDYLAKNGRTNTSAIVSEKSVNAKKARLTFRIMARKTAGEKGELLLTEIHLDTGRHHQIRVQMAHAGLPLAGDRKYFADWQSWPGGDSLALCAVSLSFYHPSKGRRITFETTPQATAFSFFQAQGCERK